MKTTNAILTFFGLALFVLAIGCKGEQQKGGRKGGRINYALIKDSMKLDATTAAKFDELTESYGKKSKETYESLKEDKAKAEEASKQIMAELDAEIKKIVDPAQYAIYEREIAIERKGREKHNMELIKTELALDSTQASKFDLANEAFYTTLRANHDNYHGKPDVYQKYYEELDVNRKSAFQELMTPQQYEQYLTLVEKYGIGKPRK